MSLVQAAVGIASGALLFLLGDSCLSISGTPLTPHPATPHPAAQPVR